MAVWLWSAYVIRYKGLAAAVVCIHPLYTTGVVEVAFEMTPAVEQMLPLFSTLVLHSPNLALVSLTNHSLKQISYGFTGRFYY